jgi:hypothetical protein
VSAELGVVVWPLKIDVFHIRTVHPSWKVAVSKPDEMNDFYLVT